jgi:hypothetical protein
MISKELMKVHMLQAMAKDENRYNNGDYNWDFIDADVYMDVYGEVDKDLRDDVQYMKWFDELAFELRYHEIMQITQLHLAQATGNIH